MDPNRIKKLEARYWEGVATLEEEQELGRLAEAGSQHLSDGLTQMFALRKNISSNALDAEFDDRFWNHIETRNPIHRFTTRAFLRYAAIGLILFGAGLGLWSVLMRNENPTHNPTVVSSADTYDDPEIAFEETKRALMFASEKLNKGKEPVTELKRFYTTRMSIAGDFPDSTQMNLSNQPKK